MGRDDFTKPVVLTLAQRAAYICTSANCRRVTSGPHSDPNKALITGKACHICAASPGGPRYDPTQTPEKRKSIENAIWLCSICSEKIDKDWKPLPAETLIQWRQEHEVWVAAEGMIPKMPRISIATCEGLRLIAKLQSIDAEAMKCLREQELSFHNPNRVPLINIHMRMRLPEAVFTYGELLKKAGTKIVANPDATPWTVTAVGSSSVSFGGYSPTPNHVLEIPELSAEETVRVAIYTIEYYQIVMMDSDGKAPDKSMDIDTIDFGKTLRWYLDGSYQFLLRGEFVTADFLVPLHYRFSNREVSSLPCQQTTDPWKLSPIMLFPGITLHG